MVHVAVYGKGGIGKSTISSNISYSLSLRGLSVTQIGCDPKHDSTVTLLNGKEQPTVLDYVRDRPPSQWRLGDLVVEGTNGIRCIEAGGPQPGIGCAGRGILTTFDTLENLGLNEMENDVTVFDVLGDVVCGGFAVPMRKENTDAVFVVTSGEFMSMYAANNILRGMLNFDPMTPRVAGIILNRRGVDDEYEKVRRLSECVGVPIVADIPRCPEFKLAAKQTKTVSEVFPESEPARIFGEISDIITEIREGRRSLYCPRPLDDGQMDDFGKGKDVGAGRYVANRKCCTDSAITSGMCASIGASHEGGRIKDLPVIIHGPTSCGYIMCQSIEGHYLSYTAQNPMLERRRTHRVICTDMEDSSSIFGGHEKLLDALQTCVDEGYTAATVITTCVTGMIGDDVNHIVDGFRSEHPGFDVLMCEADGNHTGTSKDGRQMVLDRFYGLIDTGIEPTETAMNLVDSSFMMFSQGMNETWFAELSDMVQVPVGVHLIDECTLDELRNSKRNRINVLVEDNDQNRIMQRKLEELGFRFLPQTLPHGHSETVAWIRALADALGKPGCYEDLIDRIEAEYGSVMSGYRKSIGGKSFDFVINNSAVIDWMIEAIQEAGGNVRNIYIVVTRGDRNMFHTRFRDTVRVREGGTYQDVVNALRLDPPDLILTESMRDLDIGCREAATTRECLTHRACYKFMEYLSNMLVCNGNPEWKSWRDLQ